MGVGPITSCGGGVVPAASTTVAGKVELATDAEAVTGTDTARAVTPAALAAALLATGGGADIVQYPAGGPWPMFYLDAGTVNGSSVLPLFAYWEYGGTCDIDLINPHLRIADYQP